MCICTSTNTVCEKFAVRTAKNPLYFVAKYSHILKFSSYGNGIGKISIQAIGVNGPS